MTIGAGLEGIKRRRDAALPRRTEAPGRRGRRGGGAGRRGGAGGSLMSGNLDSLKQNLPPSPLASDIRYDTRSPVRLG